MKQYLDKIFSREILGTILFGLAVGKTVEYSLRIGIAVLLGATVQASAPFMLFAWVLSMAAFLLLLLYWNDLEHGFENTFADSHE